MSQKAQANPNGYETTERNPFLVRRQLKPLNDGPSSSFGWQAVLPLGLVLTITVMRGATFVSQERSNGNPAAELATLASPPTTTLPAVEVTPSTTMTAEPDDEKRALEPPQREITPTPTATPIPTSTPSPTPTVTPTPTSTRTVTPTPTSTPTPTPTATSIPTFNPTPTPTAKPIPTSTPTNKSLTPGPNERWVDVNLTTQTLTAYAGDETVLSTLVSTGTARYPTAVGRFRVWGKFRYDDMKGPDPEAEDYYQLRDVPHVMYFYRGYGLHGTYWHDNFGQPMSHGCINLSLEAAEWLYGWAPKDMLVVIHY